MIVQSDRTIKIGRNFVKLAKLDKSPLPVDIEGVISKFGIRLIYKSFLKALDALLSYNDNGIPTIVINKEKPPLRIRFSLAHELGHYILPWHYWERVLLGRRPLHFTSEYSLEVEANLFAGEILMPFERFYEAVSKKDVNISELSNTFKVSVSAIKKRYETILKFNQN